MAAVFDSYCVVCDKKCHDSGEIYCSAACQYQESHIHTPTGVASPNKGQTPQPTYPSVLDYYMEEALELSSDEEEFVGSPHSLVSRQPMLSYRLLLRSR